MMLLKTFPLRDKTFLKSSINRDRYNLQLIKKKREGKLDPHTLADAMDQGNRVWFLQDMPYLQRN